MHSTVSRIPDFKITYDIVSEKTITKDSIYAYKTDTEITVDDYPMRSFKIKFAKE